jgi:hypothetical protein
LVDRAGVPLAVRLAPGNDHDGALGVRTVANSSQPPAILRGILPDRAKASAPTRRADTGDDRLRFRRFVQEPGVRPLIPTRRGIPSEHATGER